jgi:NDP-sugar pyrophosphorylase family protein
VVRTAYKDLVPEQKVGSVCHAGVWVDVGTPAAYLQANLDVLAGRIRTPIDPWSQGERGPGDSWVDPRAFVKGRIERCIIGACAYVPPDAHLVDCVVWEGVMCPAEHVEGAIIYDGGRVLRPE